MRLLFCIFITLASALHACAFKDKALLLRLDSFMTESSKFTAAKEARLASLKRQAARTADDTLRMRLFYELYNEYHTYRFDSAMAYLDRTAEMASLTGNAHYATLATMQRSLLLATTGLYSEASDNMKGIAPDALDDNLKYVYYFVSAWTYAYRAEYCSDNVYAPRYEKLHRTFLRKAAALAPDAATREYLTGEYLYYEGKYKEAFGHYVRSLNGLRVDTRLYAMVTYAIARQYLLQGNTAEYERYLVMAAVSDIVCPLKENMAIQELAMYLYNNDPDEIDRANRYINFLMKDALFFHNRLRIIEIGNKLSVIVTAYQQQNQRQNSRLRLMLLGISLLSASLVASLALLRRQLRIAHRHRRELADGNMKLEELNARLRDTNAVREGYVRLFIDLCAAYIDKMGRYRSLVARKIKARQADDLLKSSNSSRLTEQEAQEFFMSFDAAFLELYPDFISQFNSLLREDARITPKRKGTLTTGLRIFALIRLGVKESSEIATLLFYSPQTIYNYRSSLKNKAISRDSFEDDVARLCSTV